MEKTTSEALYECVEAYSLAQHAIADLKVAIYQVIVQSGQEGIKNADVGRALGIHMGHVKHEGHIPRTMLEIMKSEGVAEQDPGSMKWRLCHPAQKGQNTPNE